MARQSEDIRPVTTRPAHDLVQFYWHKPHKNGRPFALGFSRDELLKELTLAALSDSPTTEEAVLQSQADAIYRSRGKMIQYEPLRAAPDLFARFIRTPATSPAFLEFANAYGSLLGEEGRPELVRRWTEEHTRLRASAELVRAVQSRDVTTLNPWVQFSEIDQRQQASLTHPELPSESLTWYPTAAPSRLRTLGLHASDRFIELAAGLTALSINRSLKAAPCVGVMVLSGDRRSAHVPWSDTGEHFSLVWRPPNLLAAMWLQLSQVFVGLDGVQLQRCDWCKLPMVIGGATGRKRNRTLCSARCTKARQRANIQKLRKHGGSDGKATRTR